jgi:hypothetical protein
MAGTARRAAGQASSPATPATTSAAISAGARLTGPTRQASSCTGPAGWPASMKQTITAHHHTTAPKTSAPATGRRTSW